MRAPKRSSNGYHWTPPDKEWLEYHYITLGTSVCEMALEIEGSVGTVGKWLRRAKIPKRGYSEAQKVYHQAEWVRPKDEWLREQYETLGRSSGSIAWEVGTGSSIIRGWLREIGVKIRKSGDYSRDRIAWPSKEYLEDLYFTQELPCTEIAQQLECSAYRVRKKFKELGIPLRVARSGRGGSEARRTLEGVEAPRNCKWCKQPDTLPGAPYSEVLQAHHKNHNKKDNRLENLMWLCPICHRFETALWNLLQADKAEVKCEGRTMTITFRGG